MCIGTEGTAMSEKTTANAKLAAALTAKAAMREITEIIESDVDNTTCALQVSQVVSRYKCGMP